MTKHPSHSGERAIADAAPDSGEKPFDPSHFGKHEFPAGLREELIRAEKPRIDPKFLQDTVPPNRTPVLTEAEQPATTPRGGFAAPKTEPSLIDRDPTTLIKVPTVMAPASVPRAAVRVNAAATTDSPSAPPVDTSRTDTTVVLPTTRKPKDRRALVAGVVAALVGLLVAGLLTQPSTESAVTTPAAPKPAAITLKAQDKAEPPAIVAPAPISPAVSAPATTTLSPPAESARPTKPPLHPRQSNQVVSEPKPAAPVAPKPSSAPSLRGKQPWIDGL